MTRFATPAAFAATLSTVGAAVLTALAAAPVHAQLPSPEAGVTCRVGTTAQLSNGVLRCRVTEEVRLASICSPVVFAGSGDVNLNVRLVMRTAGVDQCVAGTGASRDSVMAPPVPGLHPEARPGVYRRVVNASAADVFVATKISFEFPQGSVYVGDASRGVTCGAGFNVDPINSGRGIRCIKTEEKVATCDGGFSVERRSGVDRCVKQERDLFGNLRTTIGQFTIPSNAGYVGLMGNPANHGWTLLTDRASTADHWRKGRPDFQLPRVS